MGARATERESRQRGNRMTFFRVAVQRLRQGAATLSEALAAFESLSWKRARRRRPRWLQDAEDSLTWTWLLRAARIPAKIEDIRIVPCRSLSTAPACLLSRVKNVFGLMPPSRSLWSVPEASREVADGGRETQRARPGREVQAMARLILYRSSGPLRPSQAGQLGYRRYNGGGWSASVHGRRKTVQGK